MGLTDPAARARWKACAASLEDAGHLVTVLEEPRPTAAQMAASSCEAAVFVMPEGKAAERRIRDLLSWAPAIMPVVVADVEDAALARALIVAGAFMTVSAASSEKGGEKEREKEGEEVLA